MNPLALTGIAALVAAALAGYAAYKYEDNAWQVKWDAHIAADAAVAQQFKDNAAAQEKVYADKAAKVESDYFAAQKQRDSIIAGLSGDADRLRHAATTYASDHSCGLPQASTAPSGPDGGPNVLAGLFNECVGLLQEGAGDAGKAYDTIHALQSFTQGVVK